jgi:signal transduction histidine kinase
MKKNMLLIAGSLILTILFYLFWWQNPLLAYLDYKLYDRFTHVMPSSHTPASTVVIEIDDKSLKALGQWPWPRIITAKLIDTIANSQPSAIVMDMVFSEEDRTSPIILQSFYNNVLGLKITIDGLPKSLHDNDAVLSDAIHRSPMVLPVFSNTDRQSSVCILPSTVTYDNFLKNTNLYPLNNLVCSLPRFQQPSQGIGHIHAMADGDGILRRLPLVMQHEDVWIPTLGMAATASVHKGIQFDAASPFVGGMKLTQSGKRFFADSHSNALLSFYPLDQYEKISVVDVLNGSITRERLKGKYVFIGSTALGLDSMYTMSDGSVRSGVYIHATMVENILNGDLGVQPSLYQPLNIILSFIIGILLLMQMIRKQYLSVVISYLAISLLAGIITALAWQYHLYLSIGYLIIPLSAYLFVLALLMFFIDYRNKKKFIDELHRSAEQKQRLQSALSASESEIEYQKAMLFQQSKLAAMGEMIDNIAHQWRQPLNLLGVIIQHAEFAYSKGKVDETYIQKMNIDSMEQILFMSQTIDDFRNFVKPDRQNILFDLNKSVEESIRLLSGMFKANSITITAEYTDTPLMTMGSPSEFKQVIINLLHNARDALLENNQISPMIHIKLVTDQSNATITLKDNGGGIALAVIDKIFDSYFTTKDEMKGSGVGLYISRAIIKTKMGGEITASNAENGALFTITLPLDTRETIA